MSLFRFVFVLCVLTVSLGNVRAISSKEMQKIKAAWRPALKKCSQEFGANSDDVKKANESSTLSTHDRCFWGCYFKEGKLIDDKGLYDAEKAKKITKTYLSDESDQKKAMEIISKCKSVNEDEVTDAEKGCERAALLLECFRPFEDMYKE